MVAIVDRERGIREHRGGEESSAYQAGERNRPPAAHSQNGGLRQVDHSLESIDAEHAEI